MTAPEDNYPRAAPQWDAFISHAWEDKESFVRPLAHRLTALGALVWYDEFSLKLGDSLSSSIDKGLAGSLRHRGIEQGIYNEAMAAA